jgi:hypothetical protein
MTSSERIALFEQAIKVIKRLEEKIPSFPPFESIHNQLIFLLEQASGAAPDCSGLARINLGLITVREVEDRDDAAAEIFYEVSGEADKMLADAEAGNLPVSE